MKDPRKSPSEIEYNNQSKKSYQSNMVGWRV